MRSSMLINLLCLGTLLVAAAVAQADPVPEPDRLAHASTLAALGSGVSVRFADDAFAVMQGDEELLRFRVALWSDLSEAAIDVDVPAARGFGWGYPHLQDILFLDLGAHPEEAGSPALEIATGDGVELVTRSLAPHDGTGSHPARPVTWWQRVRNVEGGHEYVALVRLDGARPTPHDANVYSFDAARRSSGPVDWPLAVVLAPTRAELQMRIGQAMLAFDGAGDRRDPEDWWRVPALCGLCQQQQVREVGLDLQDRGSSLLLRVRTVMEFPDHARASGEGMWIDDQPLAPWLSGQQGDEAWFVVPLDAPLADVLVNVARTGDAAVRARLSTGTVVDVPTVRVQVDPAFEERLYAAGDPRPATEEWPDHLAVDLVSSWPNPFRDSTTIEVTVPGTIEEAFELGPELSARVDPGDEPPFGTNPTVRVKVYNVSGQLVNVLDQGPRTVGRFTVGWNGQDLQGRPVASGAYYIHVEMDEWSVTRRVLLLRN